MSTEPVTPREDALRQLKRLEKTVAALERKGSLAEAQHDATPSAACRFELVVHVLTPSVDIGEQPREGRVLDIDAARARGLE